MELPQIRSISQLEFLSKPYQTLFWHWCTLLCTGTLHIILSVLIARTLGPFFFGMYVCVQWLAQRSVPALGTGMSTVTSYRIAVMQSQEAPRLMAGMFYFLWHRQHYRILLYCGFYLLCALIFSYIWPVIPLRFFLLAGFTMLPLQLSMVAGTTLRALRRGDILNLLNLCGAILTLLLFVLTIQMKVVSLEALFIANTLSQTVTLIIALVFVMRLLPLEKARRPGIFLRERLQRTLRYHGGLFLLDILIWQQAEILILVYWYGPQLASFYALSSFISTTCINAAPSLFYHWFYPILRHCKSVHFDDAYDAFVKLSCTMVFLAVPLCTLLIFSCPFLIKIILGDSYVPMIQPLRILLISTVFGSIATVSLTYLLHCEQKYLLLIRLNTVIAILKVAIALPCILRWNITGAAIASTLTQSISALATIILCGHYLRCRSQRYVHITGDRR